MSVDHCFSIKGQGTVMTGTILSGSISLGDSVEIPALKVSLTLSSLLASSLAAREGDCPFVQLLSLLCLPCDSHCPLCPTSPPALSPCGCLAPPGSKSLTSDSRTAALPNSHSTCLLEAYVVPQGGVPK